MSGKIGSDVRAHVKLPQVAERRMVLKCLAAFVCAPFLAALNVRRTYLGPMDVDRWTVEGHRKRGERVYLNGRDITDDCFFFDGQLGCADVYVRDEEGHITFDYDNDRPKQTTLFGRIEVR